MKTNPSTNRFKIGFCLGFIPAIVWVIVYFATTGTGSDAWRWFWNNPTFSVHHVFVMPVCFAVAAASFQFELFDWRSRKGLEAWGRILVPIIFLVLISCLVCFDRRAGLPAPYMLPVEKRAEAYGWERELRAGRPRTADFPKAQRDAMGLQQFTEADDGNYRVREKQYDDVIRSSDRGIIGLVNTLLTWYFAVFVGGVFWYMFLLLLEAALQRIRLQAIPLAVLDAPFRAPLILVYALLILWIPLRIYANWFENWFRNPNGWLTDHAALTLIAALASVGLVIVISLSYLDKIAAFAGVIGGVVGALAAVAGYLKPALFRDLATALDALGFAHYLGLAIMTIPVLVILGLFVAFAPTQPAVPASPSPVTPGTLAPAPTAIPTPPE